MTPQEEVMVLKEKVELLEKIIMLERELAGLRSNQPVYVPWPEPSTTPLTPWYGEWPTITWTVTSDNTKDIWLDVDIPFHEHAWVY